MKKGYKHNEESKRKISEARKKYGSPFNIGLKQSKETRKKRSIALKGKKRSKKSLENLLIANRKNGLKKKGIMPKNLSSLHGKNHWNWKGGISKINKMCRSTKEYLQWRSDIFQRDNWICQTCHKENCFVEAHHIKGFSVIIKENNIKSLDDARKCDELWNLNNGVTLCKECHSLTDNYRGRARSLLNK